MEKLNRAATMLGQWRLLQSGNFNESGGKYFLVPEIKQVSLLHRIEVEENAQLFPGVTIPRQ